MDIAGKGDGREMGEGKKIRKKILTQRLYIFGIPPHWFHEESHVIGVYTWAVVEVS